MTQIIKFALLAGLASGAGLGTCLSAGCKAPDNAEQMDLYTQKVNVVLGALEKAKFNGDVDIEIGGSPLSVGSKNVFFLGPENNSISVNGEVDFSGGGD